MTKKEKYVTERADFLHETENIPIVESVKIAIQEWDWKEFAKKEGKKIDRFFRVKGSVCQNCRFRKEKYQEIPTECKECGHFYERNNPYYAVVPSFKEN